MNDISQVRKYTKRKLIHQIRYAFYKRVLGHCGKNVFFDKNIRLMRFRRNIEVDDAVMIKEGARLCCCNPEAKIRIGKNTTVGYNTFIFASRAITIGDDCLIAPFVYIIDSNHGISRDTSINRQPLECDPVTIGNDVWIASNVTILKGVKIGDGAVIGAGSLVTEDIPEYTVAAGTPARIIKERPE